LSVSNSVRLIVGGTIYAVAWPATIEIVELIVWDNPARGAYAVICAWWFTLYLCHILDFHWKVAIPATIIHIPLSMLWGHPKSIFKEIAFADLLQPDILAILALLILSFLSPLLVSLAVRFVLRGQNTKVNLIPLHRIALCTPIRMPFFHSTSHRSHIDYRVLCRFQAISRTRLLPVFRTPAQSRLNRVSFYIANTGSQLVFIHYKRVKTVIRYNIAWHPCHCLSTLTFVITVSILLLGFCAEVPWS